MKKPYQIATRAAKESADVVEQFCQANGRLLLPIVQLIEGASQVVQSVIQEIQIQTLETNFHPQRRAGRRSAHARPSGEIRWTGRSVAA